MIERLNGKNRNQHFEWKCFNNIPLVQKHHIIPRHHGGDDNPNNIIELEVREHALAHKKLYEETGCKMCLQNYNTLMGMYRTWYRKTKIYQEPNNEVDWIEYYNEENNYDDVLENYETFEENNFVGYEPDTNFNQEYLLERVMRHLNILTERERTIVKLYLGIDTDRPLTLNEIGEQFHLTRDRIGQIYRKGLKRLRQSVESYENKLSRSGKLLQRTFRYQKFSREVDLQQHYHPKQLEYAFPLREQE
jgi:RNA polymerase sigma factor (sigma-70 family)|tara:strand:+ start:83 stop:826 length:744 start_codon:yes stop_codon:yes gene_type:complete